MMTPKDTGQAIRTERKAPGLRQDHLAAAAEVGVRFLAELESGKPTAQIGKVLSVIEALGLRILIERRSASAKRSS